MPLDADSCYRALAARDRRFDGLFFVGVASTGIYCRPVCPARTPRRDRCTFYAGAAQAELAGFRACLRCRPELSPGTAPSDRASALVRQAVARIDDGALADGSLAALARELGVTDRHLRRAFLGELGVSPVELAQSRRLALARQLLRDTRLPITEVALASGFGSLRRFHALVAARCGRPPSVLRGDERGDARRVRLRLEYRPPLAWDATLARLRRDAISGLERVADGRYTRAARLGGAVGLVSVACEARALAIDVDASLAPALMPLVARLRAMFDLDARPDVIDAHLARDPRLAGLVRTTPGVRLVGALDPLEAALRALCGRAAARLVARVGARATLDGAEWRLFPELAELAALPPAAWSEIGLSHTRAAAARALVAAVADGSLALRRGADVDATISALARLPGVSLSLASALALRALAAPDVLTITPAVRAALGPAAAARTVAESWRPWRAYAAAHLESVSRSM